MGDTQISIKNISKDFIKHLFKVIFCLSLTLFIFILFNILFILFTNIDISFSERSSYIPLMMEIVVGILFSVLSIFFIRKYLLIDTVAVVYKYLTPFFKKLSMFITQKIYQTGSDIVEKPRFTKTIDVGLLLKDSYTSKTPRIIRKGVILMINQLPFADFITSINIDMKQDGVGSQDSFSNMLYDQIDTYIRDSIFRSNNLYWLFALFIVNVVVQFFIAYLF